MATPVGPRPAARPSTSPQPIGSLRAGRLESGRSAGRGPPIINAEVRRPAHPGPSSRRTGSRLVACVSSIAPARVKEGKRQEQILGLLLPDLLSVTRAPAESRSRSVSRLAGDPSILRCAAAQFEPAPRTRANPVPQPGPGTLGRFKALSSHGAGQTAKEVPELRTRQRCHHGPGWNTPGSGAQECSWCIISIYTGSCPTAMT